MKKVTGQIEMSEVKTRDACSVSKEMMSRSKRGNFEHDSRIFYNFQLTFACYS